MCDSFCRNLPYKVSAEDMYELFGKYGAVRQIRVYSPSSIAAHRLMFCVCRGTNKDTRGTAYVVYEDLFDAKNACEHLSGYNLLGRYLIVLYYQPAKLAKRRDLERQRQELEELRARMNLGNSGETHSSGMNNAAGTNHFATPESIRK